MKQILRLSIAILSVIATTLLLVFNTETNKFIVFGIGFTTIVLLVSSAVTNWHAKMLDVIHITFAGIGALLALNIFQPTELTFTLGAICIGVVLSVAFSFMIVLPVYSAIFELFSYHKFWIFKGRHYSDGWSSKFKIFFFKKEIEFWYRLHPQALQHEDTENYGQWNKIFGIQSIIWRLTSVRKCFRYYINNKSNKYAECTYTRTNFAKHAEITEFRDDVIVGTWVHAKLVAPRMIWIGVYHYPYHGGEKSSARRYSVEIAQEKPEVITHLPDLSKVD